MTSNITNSEFNPGFLGMVFLRHFSLLLRRIEMKSRRQISSAGPLYRYRSGRLQIGRGRLAAAAVGFDVEGHFLPLDEAAHAGALDGRDVNEHIRTTRVLRDETIALLGVEKFNGTSSHRGPPLANASKRFVAVRTIRTVQIRICVRLGKAA